MQRSYELTGEYKPVVINQDPNTKDPDLVKINTNTI